MGKAQLFLRVCGDHVGTKVSRCFGPGGELCVEAEVRQLRNKALDLHVLGTPIEVIRCDFSKLESPISIAERLGFSINDWPPARTRTANFVRLTAVVLAGVVTARHDNSPSDAEALRKSRKLRRRSRGDALERYGEGRRSAIVAKQGARRTERM